MVNADIAGTIVRTWTFTAALCAHASSEDCRTFMSTSTRIGTKPKRRRNEREYRHTVSREMYDV